MGRRGFQRRKDYGLEVLAKTPGLYQVPMLRNVSCIIYFAKTAPSPLSGPLWGVRGGWGRRGKEDFIGGTKEEIYTKKIKLQGSI